MSSARRYLQSRSELGQKFGLETIQAIVEALGHPERSYPSLLIAGTNGKGSVAAYLDSALRGSSLRTGRYTSPHLIRVNERICVNGRPVGERDLDRAIEVVRACAERLVGQGLLPAHPTYFEVLTAAAFWHFERRQVDVAVLEVGLGGRLDATNVSEPLVSAIVSIDFDHEAFLGGTLPRIAREKAGVLRRGRECVLGPLPRAARRAVESAARSVGAGLVDARLGSSIRDTATGLTLVTPEFRYEGQRPLAGAHQAENLLVALRTLECARRAGLEIDLGAAAAAIGRTRWPGRLQWVPGQPRLLLDGAHNPAGARVLAAYLRSLGPFVLLFGVMQDKRIRRIAEPLFPLAEAIVLTQPPGRRSATPSAIARMAGALAAGARRESDPARALRLARRLAGRRGTVVVGGSLYLVGAVLAELAAARRLKRLGR